MQRFVIIICSMATLFWIVQRAGGTSVLSYNDPKLVQAVEEPTSPDETTVVAITDVSGPGVDFDIQIDSSQDEPGESTLVAIETGKNGVSQDVFEQRFENVSESPSNWFAAVLWVEIGGQIYSSSSIKLYPGENGIVSFDLTGLDKKNITKTGFGVGTAFLPLGSIVSVNVRKSNQ